MKGAVGNALILNIVITFITIFLLLVVGSMSYTKTIKIRNFLLTELENYVESNNTLPSSSSSTITSWDAEVNPYLAKAGYPLSTKSGTCPEKKGYTVRLNTRVGYYDYCIYSKTITSDSIAVKKYETYMVLAYMKFDIPAVGDYIKIPITGETKTYITFN